MFDKIVFNLSLKMSDFQIGNDRYVDTTLVPCQQQKFLHQVADLDLVCGIMWKSRGKIVISHDTAPY